MQARVNRSHPGVSHNAQEDNRSNKWGVRGKHPEGSDIIYLADSPSLAQCSRHPLGSSAYPGNHAVKLDKFSCEEVETEAGN